MRPTNKYILQATDSYNRSSEYDAIRQKISRLLKAGASCLTCCYFEVKAGNGGAYCRNPKKIPKNAAVRHYNICHLHPASRASTVDAVDTPATGDSTS